MRPTISARRHRAEDNGGGSGGGGGPAPYGDAPKYRSVFSSGPRPVAPVYRSPTKQPAHGTAAVAALPQRDPLLERSTALRPAALAAAAMFGPGLGSGGGGGISSSAAVAAAAGPVAAFLDGAGAFVEQALADYPSALRSRALREAGAACSALQAAGIGGGNSVAAATAAVALALERNDILTSELLQFLSHKSTMSKAAFESALNRGRKVLEAGAPPPVSHASTATAVSAGAVIRRLCETYGCQALAPAVRRVLVAGDSDDALNGSDPH
ncbi:hypothetical protein HK405_012137, partial [Cladochytrium tenue]